MSYIYKINDKGEQYVGICPNCKMETSQLEFYDYGNYVYLDCWDGCGAIIVFDKLMNEIGDNYETIMLKPVYIRYVLNGNATSKCMRIKNVSNLTIEERTKWANERVNYHDYIDNSDSESEFDDNVSKEIITNAGYPVNSYCMDSLHLPIDLRHDGINIYCLCSFDENDENTFIANISGD